MTARLIGPLLLAAAWPFSAAAQLPLSVQLPTVHVFTVQTTVSVPDRGSAQLGGIGRQRSGSTSLGTPLGPAVRRPLGIDVGVAGVSVSTTIIDTDELDRAILAEAGAAAASGTAPIRSADARAAESSASRLSVAEIRRRRAAAGAARQAEGNEYLAQAELAYQEGRLGLARACYQLAARRLTGTQRREALARLDELGGGATARRIVGELPSAR
jgi:hypothetical protein